MTDSTISSPNSCTLLLKQVSDDDLKDELYHWITTKLQELTMAEINSNDTFRQFTSFCSQTASRLEVMTHRIQKNRQFPNTQQRDGSKATSNDTTITSTIKKEPGAVNPSMNRTTDRMQPTHA